jgi:sugar lactone lactonase YvrE
MRNLRAACFALGIAVWSMSSGATGEPVIDTVAGGGPNNLPALSANLGAPRSVTVDADGNLFIAAVGQSRVFRVDGSGQLIVVAGNGTRGFSGDGDLAATAGMDFPSGVALDANGNLFIADRNNHRVRRVDAATGIMTTVAGSGTAGFSGDGGLATSADLREPIAVALDEASNLLIADSRNDRVRRVDTATGIITTVAGCGGLSGCLSGDGRKATRTNLSRPSALALDAAGNLFITDQLFGRIRRVDAASGIITTVAGSGGSGFSGDGGPATDATLFQPSEIALDAGGNLFIADTNNQRIRRVDVTTGIITTVAGNGSEGFSGDGGPAAGARLRNPIGVALDAAGNLFIADSGNQRIRRVETATGVVTTVVGSGAFHFSGDGYPATSASVYFPFAVAPDAAGNLFIADTGNSRIRRVDADSGIITTIAGSGSESFGGDGGPATDAGLNSPNGVALDAAGNLFIADSDNVRIRRVDAESGIITTVAGNGSVIFSGDGGPATSAGMSTDGVALDAAGNFFIADSRANRIRRVDAATGIITTVAGNGIYEFSGDHGPATSAGLRYPRGIALDANGNLYIADTKNRRIRRVDAATGIIITVAGDGDFGFNGDGGPATSTSLWEPYGVVPDAAGNLYIADTHNHRIRRVDAISGIITTVAGSDGSGFSGDGGEATTASLSIPVGVALDAAGNLLIADPRTDRIRQVADAIITIAVDIDIKPGDSSNAVAPAKQSVIPVAILGSESFDVSEVDGTTLNFATGMATPVHDLDDPGVFADHLEDVNGDGFTDLVSHYRTEETGIALRDTMACLSGETLAGVPIEGCDDIRVVRGTRRLRR